MTTTRDEQQEMQDGAERIAEQLNNLCAFAGHYDPEDQEQRVAVREIMRDYNGHAPADDELSDENEVTERVSEILSEYGLDLYQTGSRRVGGDWEATGWVFVVGTGGPHYELRDDGYVHGWGWFDANKVRAAVNSTVTEHFEQYFDNFE